MNSSLHVVRGEGSRRGDLAGRRAGITTRKIVDVRVVTGFRGVVVPMGQHASKAPAPVHPRLTGALAATVRLPSIWVASSRNASGTQAPASHAAAPEPPAATPQPSEQRDERAACAHSILIVPNLLCPPAPRASEPI